MSTDPLVQLRLELDRSLPSSVSLISQAEAYCSVLSLPIDLISGSPSKQALSAKQLNILMASLVSKPLHGKYITLLQSGDVDK